MRSAATLLVAVVGTILVIACANVANLLLSKAVSRRRELAVRLAVGANRWRIVRQLLTESILLSLAGGAAGIALAFAIVQAFKVAAPPAGVFLPVAVQFAIDGRVLLFAFVLSFVTGIVFGLLPALQASNPNVTPTLKDESFVPDERGRRIRMKQSLVVAEIALTVVLLVAAGLFIRSLRKSQQVDPGIASNELLSAPLNVNLLRYTRLQGRNFYQNVIDRVSALPGVVSASVARVAVLSGAARVTTINIEGRQPPNDPRSSENRGISAVESDTANANVVSPDFLNTLGISLVQGRNFNMDDAEDRRLEALVSETFERRFFPDGDALGKRISTASQKPEWTEIVGIVRDSKYGSLNEETQPVVFLPIRQRHETGVTLYVRTSTSPENLIASVRHEIQQLEPNLPVPDIQTMNQTIAASLYVPRMAAWLIGILGALAMGLTSLGVYGVLSFAISRRTRELGIRMALGADSARVLRLVIKDGMLLLAIGLVLGMTGAAFFSMALAGFLFGVDTHDLVTFVTVPVVLTFVAFAACYVPARRAVGVDPMKAIREV
jgi:putative ABC transport system permease protein